MRREDALREFEAKADAMLTAQEAMFWERLFVRKSQVAARLRESLARLARKAAARKKDCRYIYCSLLRVDLLNSRYITLLQAVGEEYALDPEPVEEQLDLGDFFDELEAVRVELVQSLPRYRGKVNPSDVQNLTAARAMEWFRKIGFLLRFVLRDQENQEEILRLVPAEFPRILRWGEYRDRGETIFFYQEKPDREGRLGALLRQSYSYPYILQNQYLRLGEYEKMNLKERRMEYITFEGCSFRDVSFEAASLWGARFLECRFCGCSFRQANLAMACFENCRFGDADWTEAEFGNTLFLPEPPPGVSEEQKSKILVKEEQYNAAVFLCGAGQEGPGHHPSGGI